MGGGDLWHGSQTEKRMIVNHGMDVKISFSPIT